MIFSFDPGPRVGTSGNLRKDGHRHGDRCRGRGERLIDQGNEGTPKSRYQDARGRFDDQVDRPWILASADEIDVPGVTLVHVCPEVREHSRSGIRPRALSGLQKQSAATRGVPIGDAIMSCCLSLAWDAPASLRCTTTSVAIF